MAEVEPETEELDGKGSLVAFVVCENLRRRQLTVSQIAGLSQKILPMVEAEAKERQREGGGDRKSEEYQKSVAANSPQAIQPVPEAPQREKTARQIVAEMMPMPVGERIISDAKVVAREAPEKFQEIKEGKTTVNEVMKEIRGFSTHIYCGLF
jgi:hypothetical protein